MTVAAPMTLDALLARIDAAGIRLRNRGGELGVAGSPERLDPGLLAALRAHKAALLERVGSGGEWWTPPPIRPEMLTLVALTQAQIDAVVAAVPGGAANVQDIYPLAPLQEGFLFHHLLADEGDPYLLGTIARFGTREGLDAYLDALRAVIARHDILRTSIAWHDLPEPVQVVWREAPLAVEEVRVDPAADDVAAELYRRFDPRHHRLDLRRAPLLRCYVAHDAAQGRWVLLQLRHHLAGDHTAGEVLNREIQAHLRGEADRLPVPLPFRNFVAQVRLGAREEEHRAFFTELLGDVDEPTAPFGLLDVRGDGSGIGEARVEVEGPLVLRLRERARALGVSAATLCHLAWALVLARASGRDDVVFGTVLFGRMQGGEGADRTLGTFINTLPVRIRLGDAGVEASVRHTHGLLAGLLRHEHASLALAQRCSAVEGSAPLFTALLNYRHGARKAPSTGPAAPAGTGPRFLTEERSNYPVTMSVDDLGEAMRLTAKVKPPVDPGRVCAMMRMALEGVVEALETAPGRPVGSIGVLPADERARVLQAWNRTEADYPDGACMPGLVEAQVARTPDAVAVAFEGERLTYGELNARANRLAHHLRGLGVGPDVRVGVCVERSPEMVVGLLAVLKAGGAYVPLDPGYPAERLAYMLADSAPAAVLTQARLRDRVERAGVPVLELDAPAPAWAHHPATDPGRGALAPEHLVYMSYTSGSTGRPKGVMNPHRGLVNRLAWMQARHGLGVGEGVLQNSSFSFDASVFEIFWPLSVGGRVVLPRPGGHLDPDYLIRLIHGERVSTAYFVCSMLQLFLEYEGVERCTALTRVLCGGEALLPALAQRVRERLPRVRLHNLYGPTESAVSVTGQVCDLDDVLAGVPIGRPAPNVRVYLLDARGEPVPVGVAGELYVGGAQLARGYLARPALTAERFLPDPFGGGPGGRLYRTGDRARWLPDGTLEFLGRVDFQVKVRGFRIEPAEIEARLTEHPGVREAVVMAREDTPGDTRLAAYWVGEALEAEALRAHLGQALPPYMVPSAYVRMERLPLTPNGKLDRKALPAPEGDAYGGGGYEAPEGETEGALAAIWSEVLGIERVGRHDDFFALGGHSLLATRLVVRIRHEMDVDLALRDVFDKPVLSQLAQLVLDAQLAQFDPVQMARLAELVRASAGD